MEPIRGEYKQMSLYIAHETPCTIFNTHYKTVRVYHVNIGSDNNLVQFKKNTGVPTGEVIVTVGPW